MVEVVRIACGGVECVPKRLPRVERLLRGASPTDEMADAAGAAAIRGAKPLNYNHFKVPLMENLVKRVVRSA